MKVTFSDCEKRIAPIVGAFLLFFGLVYIVIKTPGKTAEIFGHHTQLENFFSPLNALLSGAALIALMLTIYYQYKTIQNTTKAYKIQSFEGKYFKMLDNYMSMLSKISISIEDCDEGKRTGLDAVQELNKIMKREYDKGNFEFYKVVYELYGSSYGHVFKYLYHTIRLVDEFEVLNENQKKGFLRLLRAQLSSSEYVFIYYNGLYFAQSKSKPGTKCLIEKYHLFNGMDKSHIFDMGAAGRYDDRAFYPDTPPDYD